MTCKNLLKNGDCIMKSGKCLDVMGNCPNLNVKPIMKMYYGIVEPMYDYDTHKQEDMVTIQCCSLLDAMSFVQQHFKTYKEKLKIWDLLSDREAVVPGLFEVKKGSCA